MITKQLTKDDFEHVIIQAGSVDITNLNTKDNPMQYMEYFRQEAIMSATNLFIAVEDAIKAHPGLNKVVIMKQIPRYDPSDVDPLALKPSLSILFNNTMTNLWMASPYKEKIHIGSHNLEYNGAIRESRYRHTKSGRFDGYHLFGASGGKFYTLSILNILRAANITSADYNFHQTCPQFKFQNRQNRKSTKDTTRPNARQFRGKQKYNTAAGPIPTYNRFNGFHDMDQGNW